MILRTDSILTNSASNSTASGRRTAQIPSVVWARNCLGSVHSRLFENSRAGSKPAFESISEAIGVGIS